MALKWFAYIPKQNRVLQKGIINLDIAKLVLVLFHTTLYLVLKLNPNVLYLFHYLIIMLFTRNLTHSVANCLYQTIVFSNPSLISIKGS